MRPLLLVGSLSALPESVEVGRISDLRDRLLDFKPTAPVAVAVGMPQCKFRFRNGEPGAIQCRITIAQSRACTDFPTAVGALSSSSQFLCFFVFAWVVVVRLWLADMSAAGEEGACNTAGTYLLSDLTGRLLSS